jgi:hypothetical protein
MLRKEQKKNVENIKEALLSPAKKVGKTQSWKKLRGRNRKQSPKMN